ncbi:NAD(P)/FAD-dependent oxidoreductase [Pseudenhygromyxa sp. WMMC2535]|uniref:phytoene desaturase family protein n=1 Tax=Pseudenhygromyxa sp. WMMC2535 TaxID=2712867 RepID=UPI001556BA22|nr:NAD(P)/FAD-dependent oxidoreductase [Pseudenhygromyxa sp. WMMC2535]NVB38252.1 NAD(P)/FAD-dependent oxidoreductase [Pseudenhygromyxa sp. WMMC2535]
MTKLGSSYKQTEVDERWDAIVIGSGLGGLSTAALLSEAGKRVLVLERHYALGGFTHTFTRKGYEWDVGVHYVGEVHRERSVIAQLFDHVSGGELKWANMGEVYDRIYFGEREYAFRAGVDNFKADMREHFPDAADGRAIDQYVDLVFEAVKAGRSYYAERAMAGFKAWAAGPFMRRKYLEFTRKTTWEVLRGLTDNLELIGVLTGQYGDYGLPPRQSAFATHASVAKHYFFGGNYPVGGSAEFARTIAPRIESGGGALLTNAEVDEVVVEGGRAVGVRMADGRELRAPLIISNAGAVNTYGELLPQAVREEIGFRRELDRLPSSAAHLSLYLGFEHSAAELELPKANYWLYPEGGYDHDANLERFARDDSGDFPMVYISFPSAKDPDFERRYPGRATVEIITFAPWERFSKWADEPWRRRGEDYEAIKHGYSERLLEALYRMEPQTRGKVAFHELSTPLSTRHFTAYRHGEIYGLSHGPERFEARFLRAQTPVRGLYMTGQDVVSCGLAAAVFSGYLTASAILERNLVMDTMNRAG